MDAVKFTLSGKTAFFKKPDVNSYFYFSYSMIHKVALLGLLGAISGYGGYNKQSMQRRKGKGEDQKNEREKEDFTFPEFYEKLRHLKVAVIPYYHTIEKKMQSFNNSVGYASREQGGNLIVKEQWLENPKWDIYIAIDHPEAEKLAKCLREQRFVYIPYLGKNDHLADLYNIEICRELELISEPERIDSLFPRGEFELTNMGEDLWDSLDRAAPQIFKYEEKLPLGLDSETNRYQMESFLFTNSKVNRKGNTAVYRQAERNLVFF